MNMGGSWRGVVCSFVLLLADPTAVGDDIG